STLTVPITATGTIIFHDCTDSNGYSTGPGIYYLNSTANNVPGLEIDAGSGAAFTGSNIMFFSKRGFSIGGASGSTINFIASTKVGTYRNLLFFQDRASHPFHIDFNPDT